MITSIVFAFPLGVFIGLFLYDQLPMWVNTIIIVCLAITMNILFQHMGLP